MHNFPFATTARSISDPQLLWRFAQASHRAVFGDPEAILRRLTRSAR